MPTYRVPLAHEPSNRNAYGRGTSGDRREWDCTDSVVVEAPDERAAWGAATAWLCRQPIPEGTRIDPARSSEPYPNRHHAVNTPRWARWPRPEQFTNPPGRMTVLDT